MDIGTRIKVLRIAAKMEQKDLASEMQVSTSLVSLIENSKREPSLSQLKKICRIFSIPLSVLVHDDEATQSRDLPRKFQQDANNINEIMLKAFSQFLGQGPAHDK